jgi:hypothetical protein
MVRRTTAITSRKTGSQPKVKQKKMKVLVLLDLEMVLKGTDPTVRLLLVPTGLKLITCS